MFDKATKKLVEQTDGKGALIAASSLNDSKKLQLLAVVHKIQKGWIWQQTKYKPTVFKLNDLLEGDPVKPVCEAEEFVKFEGEYKNLIAATLEVGGSAICLNANGQGTSKLCLSLGKLKKEAVDIPKLMKLTRGRKLDLMSSFFKKPSSKNKTLYLVKERIVTTCNSTISYSELDKIGCQAEVGCSEMYMKDTGKYQHGSKTKCDIPPETVLAYSVIELSFERDGYFEWSFGPSGIESDDISQNSFPNFSEVDGQGPLIQQGSPLTILKKALADVQATFGTLADLPAESRSSFLLLLRKILKDRCVLSALVDRLEALSSGEAPCFLPSELSEEQSQHISVFLDLLKCDQLYKTSAASLTSYNECQISTTSDPSLASELNRSSSTAEERNGCHTADSHENGCSTKESSQNTELMYAMQMLMNALHELMDDGLNLLEPFCTSEGLQSLQDLVIHLTTNDMPLCKDTISVFLQSDSDFHRVEELFRSCSVSLRKENDTLTSEITCKEGFLPMVLCISIHGLASLVAV